MSDETVAGEVPDRQLYRAELVAMIRAQQNTERTETLYQCISASDIYTKVSGVLPFLYHSAHVTDTHNILDTKVLSIYTLIDC